MNLLLARLLKKYSFEVATDIEIPPKVFLRGTLVAKEMKLKINGKYLTFRTTDDFFDST